MPEGLVPLEQTCTSGSATELQGDHALRHLQLVLQRAGWEIHYVDVDLAGDAPPEPRSR